MKIKQAKEIIKYEVASTGEATLQAIRIYSEHRISKATFDKLIREGKALYNATQKKDVDKKINHTVEDSLFQLLTEWSPKICNWYKDNRFKKAKLSP